MASKKELIKEIAAAVEGCSQSQAEAVVDAFLEKVANELSSGRRVMLPGFGSFTVKQRPARLGRNPRTGATIQIRASRAAKFKMAKNLKAALAGDPIIVLPDESIIDRSED